MKRLVQYFLLLFLLITPVCVFISMGVFTLYYPQSFSFREIPWFILILLFQFFCFKKIDLAKISKQRILIFAFVLLNIFLCLSLFTFDTQPVSDYKAIWNYAGLMADNKFYIGNYQSNDYIYLYNWQIGISAFESLFIRGFGENFEILKFLNLILINITVWMTYFLSKCKFGERASCYTVLLFSSYYPVIVTCGQFTNQHIAALLILIVLFLIEKRTYPSMILAAVLAAILNVIRPMGIIINIAFILWTIYELYSKQKRLKTFLSLCIYLCVYVTAQYSLDQMFMSIGYADGPVSEAKIPYFKFDKGLTGYDSPNIDPFNNDIEKYNEWQKNKLVNLIKEEPQAVIGFVANKMIRYLGLFDYKFENTYNHDVHIWQAYPIKFFYSIGWAAWHRHTQPVYGHTHTHKCTQLCVCAVRENGY